MFGATTAMPRCARHWSILALAQRGDDLAVGADPRPRALDRFGVDEGEDAVEAADPVALVRREQQEPETCRRRAAVRDRVVADHERHGRRRADPLARREEDARVRLLRADLERV